MKTGEQDQRQAASVATPDRDMRAPSRLSREAFLMQELFEYTLNWAKRFYAIRQEAGDVAPGMPESYSDTIARAHPTPVHRIHDFIVTHLHQGLSLRDLSEHFGYSEKYCSEFFVSHMGEPFTVYVKRVRLHTAKRLLQNPNKTMAEIAEVLGFQDQFSFSRFFKKETGLAPRAFRHALQQDAEPGQPV